MLKAKISKNNLYISPSNQLVRAIVVNTFKNEVIVYNYGSQSNEVFDSDFIRKCYEPAFLIGEVAYALNRKPTTIRKYESLGKIPEARKFKIGRKNQVRVYTMDEVKALRDFFSEQATRRPPGRGTMAEREVASSLASMYERKFER